MKANFILAGALATLLFVSCTDTFRYKMQVADKYVDDMEATGVTCGTSTQTNNGTSMSMTTLTFTGCRPEVGDVEREWMASRVAKDFLGEMTDKDLEGETHLKIGVETTDGAAYEYLFPLNELKEVGGYLAITDKALQACVMDDEAAFDQLKDNKLMPDEEMYQIYLVTHYNDSLFAGQPLDKKMLGYRFAEGANNADLKLFSVDYDVQGETAHTFYTINLDRDTKKVVYVWLKTNPY